MNRDRRLGPLVTATAAVAAALAATAMSSAPAAAARAHRPANKQRAAAESVPWRHTVRRTGSIDPESLPGRIAFNENRHSVHESYTEDRVAGLDTAALDGSDEQRLDVPQGADFDYGPQWSPDGRWIVFWHSAQNTSPHETVQLIPRDGGTPQTIAAGEAPTWSPDGSTLAWSAEDASGNPLLVTVPVTAETADKVTLGTPTSRAAPGSTPVFSPDGTHVLLGGDDGLWNYPLDGGTAVRLDGGRRTGGDTNPRQAYGWSPDGSFVAFVSGETKDGADDNRAYAVLPDGSDLHRLDPGAGIQAYNLAWSPTGAVIAVQTNREGVGISLITPTGQTVERLSTERFGEMGGLSFSPDGTRIYTVAAPRAADPSKWPPPPPDMWSLPVDGAPPQRLTYRHEVWYGTVAAVDPGAALRLFAGTAIGTAALPQLTDGAACAGAAVLTADRTDAGTLSATTLAAAARCPLLLTDPDLLSPATETALRRLHVSKVVTVGKLASAVTDDLRSSGVSVIPVAPSEDADGTAAAVASLFPAHRGVVVTQAPEGRTGWGDLLVAGGYAASHREPLLVAGRNGLSPAAMRALRRLHPRSATWLGAAGDMNAHNAHTRAQLRRVSRPRIRSIAAATPAALSLAVARYQARHGGRWVRSVMLSTRPWSASAVALCRLAWRHGLLLVTDGRQVSHRFLHAHRRRFDRLTVVGPPRVFAARTEARVERALAAPGT